MKYQGDAALSVAPCGHRLAVRNAHNASTQAAKEVGSGTGSGGGFGGGGGGGGSCGENVSSMVKVSSICESPGASDRQRLLTW